jgi:hypothetical protein
VAEYASQQAGVPVVPVVCVASRTSAPTSHDDVIACAPGDIIKVIKSIPDQHVSFDHKVVVQRLLGVEKAALVG